MCFVLEVIEPGLLVVKHHRGEKSGKYVNVAVLEGDQVKLVDDAASSLPDCPALITLAARVRLAVVVGRLGEACWCSSRCRWRAHGRGGLLLIVPSASESWRDSMVSPMTYAISPPLPRAERAAAPDPHRQSGPARFRESLREVVDVVAGLTAVDGAAVMTDAYELLAFGSKIARRRGSPQVELVTVTEPVVGGVARTR